MNSKVLKRLLSYIGNYKGRFALALVTVLIGTVCSVFAPKVLGEISTILYAGVEDQRWVVEYLEDGTPDVSTVWFWVGGQENAQPVGKVGSIVWIAIFLVILYLIFFAFCFTANMTLANISANMVRDIRKEIDVKMHRMKLNYYDTRTNGEILSVITNDVDAVNTLFGKNLYQILSQIITLVGVVIMLLTVNGWMTLIALVMIPMTLLAAGSMLKAGGKNYAAQQNLLGDVNGYVEEMYNGQNVVASFNYQKKAIARFYSSFIQPASKG